jgi:hypothetical protein
MAVTIALCSAGARCAAGPDDKTVGLDGIEGRLADDVNQRLRDTLANMEVDKELAYFVHRFRGCIFPDTAGNA